MSRKHLKSTDAAYVAGIIDGEGCVSIARSKIGHTVSGYQYQPRLSVTNTDLRMLKFIKAVTGLGTICERGGSKKRTWCWCSASQVTGKILKSVRKYLVIKRTRADYCIKLADIQKKNWHRKGRKGLTQRERDYQERLYWRVKELNT